MAEGEYYCVESEYLSMEDGQPKVPQSDGEIKKKEQKDAELDKKIKALRKKNEALVRRYQEIEEDRRNAEKEGKAITSQRPKQENLTITITKTPKEKRIVSESWRDCDNEDEQRLTLHVGNEMQLAVTVDSKVEGKKMVSKKNDQDYFLVTSKVSNLSSKEVDNLFTFGRGRRMQIAITMQKEAAKRKVERKRVEPEKIYAKEQNKSSEKCEVSCSGQPLTKSARERIDYLQWKKEREQIDLERVARHKNSKGEWRRAWDIEKTEDMFDDDVDTVPSEFYGRRGEHHKISLKRPTRI